VSRGKKLVDNFRIHRRFVEGFIQKLRIIKWTLQVARSIKLGNIDVVKEVFAVVSISKILLSSLMRIIMS
jgi:hypothetical protein